MKTTKAILCFLLLILCILFLTGCWNYREVEKLAIVSGVAVDRKENGILVVTVEIADVKQGQGQTELKPVYVQSEGDTFFSAIRTIVALQGRRLFWSHAKVIILSEEIARDGISSILDFVYRDAEIRKDMWVLISKEKSASEILSIKSELESILSFELDDTLRAQDAVSRYPAVELYELLENLESSAVSPVIPAVENIKTKGRNITYVSGAAVIKNDKLIGYIDAYEAKSLLWIMDELKGGLFSVDNVGDTGTRVSLELYKNKTKIKPTIENDQLIMNIDIVVDVIIGEIMGSTDFTDEKGRDKLEKDAESQLKLQLENFIEKAQKKYKTDFLDFGLKIKHTMPKVWNTIEEQWEDMFTDLDTV